MRGPRHNQKSSDGIAWAFHIQDEVELGPRERDRANERALEGPLSQDVLLTFIGRIHTPWMSRLDAPRRGRADGPICRIEVFEPWAPALRRLDRFERVEVLYWLHLSPGSGAAKLG